ncbi:MAG: hypothetical protein SNJ52_00320 [Verrucomicrobiia bacterium]
MISQPLIWQHRPLRHGVHCFYYDPEGGDLIETLRNALADRSRLEELGYAARRFALECKTESTAFATAIFDFYAESGKRAPSESTAPGRVFLKAFK